MSVPPPPPRATRRRRSMASTVDASAARFVRPSVLEAVTAWPAIDSAVTCLNDGTLTLG